MCCVCWGLDICGLDDHMHIYTGLSGIMHVFVFAHLYRRAKLTEWYYACMGAGRRIAERPELNSDGNQTLINYQCLDNDNFLWLSIFR